jgi:hypothetical protein
MMLQSFHPGEFKLENAIVSLNVMSLATVGGVVIVFQKWPGERSCILPECPIAPILQPTCFRHIKWNRLNRLSFDRL